jgi:hypothetical protein
LQILDDSINTDVDNSEKNAVVSQVNTAHKMMHTYSSADVSQLAVSGNIVAVITRIHEQSKMRIGWRDEFTCATVETLDEEPPHEIDDERWDPARNIKSPRNDMVMWCAVANKIKFSAG